LSEEKGSKNVKYQANRFIFLLKKYCLLGVGGGVPIMLILIFKPIAPPLYIEVGAGVEKLRKTCVLD